MTDPESASFSYSKLEVEDYDDEISERSSLHLRWHDRYYSLSGSPLLKKQRKFQVLLGFMGFVIVLTTFYIVFSRDETVSSVKVSPFSDSDSTSTSISTSIPSSTSSWSSAFTSRSRSISKSVSTSRSTAVSSVTSVSTSMSVSRLKSIPSSTSKSDSMPTSSSTAYSTLDSLAEHNSDEDSGDRPLILYAYHETEIAFDNAMFFLKHGLHDGADFIFIINGESTIKLKIPVADHIRVIQRNNTCFDIGAFGEILTANSSALVNKYNRFIMMNASIRGPFLPTWSSDCWTDAYLNKVTEKNKLVGISVNCRGGGWPHVQSMLLATDRTGLKVLTNGVITPCFANMHQAQRGEMNITRSIRRAGYTVNAFMTAFSSDADYTHTCEHGDVLRNNRYFNTSIHPYETIFQKANRNIFPLQLKMLTEWHDKANYSSQPFCGRDRKVHFYRDVELP